MRQPFVFRVMVLVTKITRSNYSRIHVISRYLIAVVVVEMNCFPVLHDLSMTILPVFDMMHVATGCHWLFDVLDFL
jgi:hypothetical protein